MQKPWTIDAEHLALAAEIVGRHAQATPLIEAAALLGHGAYLKLEDAQETGSFKLRGALTALAALDADVRARGVVTSSAGNHGAGLARAGVIFGAPVTVFVGRATPAIKREKIAALGAQVEIVDAVGYDDVEERARAAAIERDQAFVSPFDDPWVAAGNGGTVGLEILDALPDARAIVAPVGGGGLVSGLAAALRSRGSRAALIGVQSAVCPAMVESLRVGRALTRYEGKEETIAEGLEGGVSESTFAIARASLARMEAVSEAAIEDAIRAAHRALDLTLEGSASVALAWALVHRAELERPFVVLVTGRNIDPERFVRIAGCARRTRIETT